MKTITFQGRELQVPDWAKWVAQDADGAVWAYDSEPLKGHDEWYVNGGELCCVFESGAPMVKVEL